jgi:hypothetical protein
MIRLSQSDWVEVFHALQSKLEECELWLDGSPESDKSVRMWIEKLKGIQANIGPMAGSHCGAE